MHAKFNISRLLEKFGVNRKFEILGWLVKATNYVIW